MLSSASVLSSGLAASSLPIKPSSPAIGDRPVWWIEPAQGREDNMVRVHFPCFSQSAKLTQFRKRFFFLSTCRHSMM